MLLFASRQKVAKMAQCGLVFRVLLDHYAELLLIGRL